MGPQKITWKIQNLVRPTRGVQFPLFLFCSKVPRRLLVWHAKRIVRTPESFLPWQANHNYEDFESCTTP